MAGTKRLVVQHLENVSWELLHKYPGIVKDLIRGKSGIYALYRKDKLYYIGLASNLMARLKTHLRDRHHGRWQRFSVYLTVSDEHMKELESIILRAIKPPGNKVTGTFAQSKNLHPIINNMIKEVEADQRARVLGGSTARRRRRRKARQATGSEALAGVFERAVRLRGEHSGYEYRASLRRNGTISYDGHVFDSPTGAARAAVGRSVNGWSFWCYKKPRGEWIKLRTLKR